MLRTILFYTHFWLTLILSSPLILLYVALMPLGLHRAFRGLLGAGARGWARTVVWATGATVSVEGAHNVPKSGGVCLVGNHQGSMEIPIIIATLPRTPGFITKREALFLPFLNLWILALGGVFIHRKSARKARAAIERGAKRLRDGAVMIIYPEGTRSRGDHLGVFKPGSFKLATLAGVPIVPVTVDGSWRVWEEHTRIRPAPIRVTMHPPIATAGLSAEERKALPERVRAVIASALPAGAALAPGDED
jgi:1-acyl-sn-glycerol-3-phosphate acyltransferase